MTKPSAILCGLAIVAILGFCIPVSSEHDRRASALRDLAAAEADYRTSRNVADLSLKLMRARRYQHIDADSIIAAMGKPDARFADIRNAGDAGSETPVDILAYRYLEYTKEHVVLLHLIDGTLVKGLFLAREDIPRFYPECDRLLTRAATH